MVAGGGGVCGRRCAYAGYGGDGGSVRDSRPPAALNPPSRVLSHPNFSKYLRVQVRHRYDAGWDALFVCRPAGGRSGRTLENSYLLLYRTLACAAPTCISYKSPARSSRKLQHEFIEGKAARKS